MACSSDNSSEKFDESLLYLDELAQWNTEKNSSRSTIVTVEDVDVSAGESGVEDQLSGSSGSDDDDCGIKMMQKLLSKAKNASKKRENGNRKRKYTEEGNKGKTKSKSLKTKLDGITKKPTISSTSFRKSHICGM